MLAYMENMDWMINSWRIKVDSVHGSGVGHRAALVKAPLIAITLQMVYDITTQARMVYARPGAHTDFQYRSALEIID